MLLVGTMTLGTVASVFLIFQCTKSPVVKTWYYDLNEKVVFAGPQGQLAPLPAPSGDLKDAPPGTLAGVNVEVEIASDSLPTPLLLRTYTPEARQALSSLAVLDAQRSPAESQRLGAIIAEGSLTKLPDDINWVVEASPAGKAIFETFARRKLGGVSPASLPEPKK